jgi:hypothetical protein
MKDIRGKAFRHRQIIVLSVAAMAIFSYILPISNLFSMVQANTASVVGKYGGRFPGKGNAEHFPGKGATSGDFPGRGHGVSYGDQAKGKHVTNNDELPTRAKGKHVTNNDESAEK